MRVVKSFALVAAGFVGGYFFHQHLQSSRPSEPVHLPRNVPLNSKSQEKLSHPVVDIKPEAEKEKIPPKFDPGKKAFLASAITLASEDELRSTLRFFFDDRELNTEIGDLKQFSKRLQQEFSGASTENHELSIAQMYFSTSASYPQQAQNFFHFSGNEKLYAHIDVQQGLGSGDAKLFTRWTHIDSGDVILFDRKQMRSDSDKNWISYRPPGQWQAGTYEVSFYRFNAEMDKLASDVFTVATD